jgi:Protein of unknown function (DUF3305)
MFGRNFFLDILSRSYLWHDKVLYVADCPASFLETGGQLGLIHDPNRFEQMPVGIVLRRVPGVTQWAAWSWKATGVLPGAADASWRVLRTEGDMTEYHATTLPVELHGAETEAYLHGLAAQEPALYVVMRESVRADEPLDIVLITASPYEAQDYADSGEEIIEKIAMPAAVMAWVLDFVETHHREEIFKKRKRDKKDIGLVEDGVGDARITQMADVYRAPSQAKKERLQ